MAPQPQPRGGATAQASEEAPTANNAENTGGTSNTNSESTTASRVASSIQADLDGIEVTLGHVGLPVGGTSAATNTSTGAGADRAAAAASSLIGGRAAFESIGSALGGARARLDAVTQADTGPGAGSGGGGSGSSSNSSSSHPLVDVADRLRTLERAYSSRVPLSRWSGRSLSRVDEVDGTGTTTTTSTGTSTVSNVGREDGAAAPHATNIESSGGRNVLDDDSEPFADSLKDDRRNNLARTTSALLASRRLAAEAGYADANGFDAAQAGVLSSIAERRDSVAASMATSSSRVSLEGETASAAAADNDAVEGTDADGDYPHGEEDMQVDEKPVDDPTTLPRPPPGGTKTTTVPGKPVIYSWGIGSAGALLQEDAVDYESPSNMSAADSRVGKHQLLSIAASSNHAAVSTATGSVFSCGTNVYGVVDPLEGDDRAMIVRPRSMSESLGAARVVSVSCGVEHTAAVRANGMVMTWGNDGGGRLGHRRTGGGTAGTEAKEHGTGEDNRVGGKRKSPAAMQLPPGRRAASVSCGSAYTLVLTTRREVLGCGSWSDLQLTPTPTPLAALGGMPIALVSAGDGHAVVTTEFGSAYAWGENLHGCCGRVFPRTISSPAPVVVPETSLSRPVHDPTDGGPATELSFKNWARWDGRRHPPSIAEDVRVVDVACGSGFTIMVCASGRLLVCGSNNVGQLGTAPCAEVCSVASVEHPEEGPKKTKFVSVEAGISHALLLDDCGDVWQTGSFHCSGPERSSSPTSTLVCAIRGLEVTTIAAGGHQSYALASGASNALSRQFSVASDLLMTNGQSKTKAPPTSKDWSFSLLSGLEVLIDKVVQEEKEISESEAGHEAASVKDLAASVEELLSWPAVLGSLFLDPLALDRIYKRIIYSDKNRRFIRPSIAMAMQRGVDRGTQNLLSCGARFIYPESVRCLLLYLQCPLFSDDAVKHTSGSAGIIFDEGGELFQLLCETVVSLPFEGYRSFIAWATSLYDPTLYSQLLIRPLLCHLDIILGASGSDWRFRHQLPIIVSILRWLHEASEQCVPHIVAPEAFYSEAVSNLPTEALYEDLSRWKEASQFQRSSNFFLSGHPFLLSATGKRNLLQVENQLEMVQAATATLSYDAQQRGFVFDPYFVLAIDRKYMLQQTLQKVDKAAPGELRKQLKVVFKGEDGVDAGGVTKEFFQLLVAQLFDVSTGMWQDIGPNNTLHWFNGNCTWNRDGYHLVGILTGLALYNGVLLDVDFPVAVYRKLLRQPLGLEDMVDKETSRGLQQLLDYDGDDVEDIFCLTFSHVLRDSFGKEQSVELKPGGANISVTSDNKEEYVVLYVKWFLVDSVQDQYEAFEAGFMQVMETSSIMHVLRPDELELLIVGTPNLDFSALKDNTEYEGGYDADSPVVVNFWRFVQESEHETQVRLLKFSTGSCRAPIGGLGNLFFKVQKGDPEGRQLPSSHTCFNTLILPDYGDDYDRLKNALSRAVLECEGFGLQ